MNILSVDFDYWFPEKIEYDWGHQESPFFIESIWSFRAAQMLVDGNDPRTSPKYLDKPYPFDFRNFLKEKGWTFKKRFQVFLAESHASAYHALSELSGDLTIYHIDAHHDFGYNRNLADVDCGNWLYHLAKDCSVRDINLVYPLWRENQYMNSDGDAGNPEMPHQETLDTMKHLTGKMPHITYGLNSLPNDVKVDVVFICRSGAWVPPWLDEDFLLLASSFFAGRVSLYTWKSLDDIRRRFPEWKDIEEQARQLREQMERFISGGDPLAPLTDGSVVESN